ncbi:MAG: DUF4240 domain-containing protein [Pseudomonadales bacterium]|jgi:hypothetical protein|nr:DUF4240 domain-containing protein [Pseudomonadales bacterium]
MNIDKFWLLTGNVDQAALISGNENLAVSPLISALAELPPKEIRAYEEHLCKMLYKLDGENFAEYAGESGNSDDGFLYARCYVVAKGRDYYKSVLSNPENMPTALEQWCEPLLTVAAEAWSQRTGHAPEDWDFETSVSYETGSNTEQWPSIPPQSHVEEDPFVENKLERAVARAGHHYRSKQYEYVFKLLKQHEARLSHKQRQMLYEASAHLPSTIEAA